MMNANEARNRTNELLTDENKRMESLRAWVEETCGAEIEKAVETRKFTTVVEVPKHHNTVDVANELINKGYTVEICWGGFINQITISWRKKV